MQMGRCSCDQSLPLLFATFSQKSCRSSRSFPRLLLKIRIAAKSCNGRSSYPLVVLGFFLSPLVGSWKPDLHKSGICPSLLLLSHFPLAHLCYDIKELFVAFRFFFFADLPPPWKSKKTLQRISVASCYVPTPFFLLSLLHAEIKERTSNGTSFFLSFFCLLNCRLFCYYQCASLPSKDPESPSFFFFMNLFFLPTDPSLSEAAASDSAAFRPDGGESAPG